jgi:hypothetical protein
MPLSSPSLPRKFGCNDPFSKTAVSHTPVTTPHTLTFVFRHCHCTLTSTRTHHYEPDPLAASRLLATSAELYRDTSTRGACTRSASDALAAPTHLPLLRWCQIRLNSSLLAVQLAVAELERSDIDSRAHQTVTADLVLVTPHRRLVRHKLVAHLWCQSARLA